MSRLPPNFLALLCFTRELRVGSTGRLQSVVEDFGIQRRLS